MNNNYVVGLDFGMLFGCVVVVWVNDGVEMGVVVYEYFYGVMDCILSVVDGCKFLLDFVFQDFVDYLEIFEMIVCGVVKDVGVDFDYIVGIGLDVIFVIVVVVMKDGILLC